MWIRLKKGKQGDLISFHTDGKIILPDNTHPAEHGWWLRVEDDLEPMRSGNGYFAKAVQVEIEGGWYDVVMTAPGANPESAEENFWKDVYIKACQKYEADEAKRKAELEEAKREGDKRHAEKQAKDKADRERLGDQVFEFIVAFRGFDAHYSFSDYSRAYNRGRDQHDALISKWKDLPDDKRQIVILELGEDATRDYVNKGYPILNFAVNADVVEPCPAK